MENSAVEKVKIYKHDIVDAIHEYVEGDNEYLYRGEVIDQKGNILFSIEYDKKGKPERQVENIYDGENIVKQKVVNLFEEIEEIYEFIYDENQRLLKEYVLYDEERFLQQEYEYDHHGDMSAITYYDNGEEAYKEFFQYDENGNEVRREQYDTAGELLELETSEYDEQEELAKSVLETSEYDEQTGEHYSRTIAWFYEYDEFGRLVVKTEPENNYRVNYTYDEQDRLAEMISYVDGTIFEKQIFEYDNDDRIIKEAFIMGVGHGNSFHGGDLSRNSSYALRYEYESVKTEPAKQKGI